MERQLAIHAVLGLRYKPSADKVHLVTLRQFWLVCLLPFRQLDLTIID